MPALSQHPAGRCRHALRRLATAPGGKRTKWLVLAAWLIIVVALGPLAGKLGEVEDSSANAFLPGNAESAKVNTELEKFRGEDEIIPAVVVYTRSDAATTEADTAKARADRADFARFAAKGERLGGPIPAEDGKALMLVVPLTTAGDDITDDVEKIRSVAAANAPPGLDVEVGGPAGSLIDNIKVFDNLDSTLMLATGAVVTLLLLITYRSPLLWLFPVLSVGFAAVLTQVATYVLAKYASLPVDPQSAGILMVLVFGVGTDYALLLIARYREELHRHEDRHEAMRLALRRSGPAIVASAGTIAIGLACLAFADINSSRSLGLVGAVGVVCALLAMITVLPALLVVAGRRVFWPFVPRYGTEPRKARTVWSRIGGLLARRPRWSWLMSIAVTAVLALSATGITMGLTNAEMFQDKPESVVAQEKLSAHYPSGSSDPATVVVRTDARAAVQRAAAEVGGVESVRADDRTVDGSLTSLSVVLRDAPDSEAAKRTIDALRDAVHQVDGAEALVGGTTAESLDTRRAAESDLKVVIPIVLAVVLLVLVALLRSLVAPVLLLATVVLSYFGALGASHLVFEYVLDFAAMDNSLPLMGFVFLVALGIDYNIFLMTRVREEAVSQGHSRGVLAGLSSTGGVITSAGIVLAATFAVIASMPLVSMAQLGVLVGIGVLLDTFLVRTVLVPSLALDIGARIWWPSRLGRAPQPHGDARTAVGEDRVLEKV
ncbi:MMPL family transporter [Streptomyces smyrnaeus]|uniref:MMPL family transporter n=1 Tax=Streptomyces TaxID=1883 RepID=UPI000C17D2A5|nr:MULTISPECIES: MMPL family transporter [unclassified Streptomyces]MBQ0868194.1 MMPL family transporter [Streptomyces sp. RK75]MBQ1123636.1 MMPL family transporter [Streptomyces sp. B15]MBQ1161556.1 MMPL family transporter [Streptomyces sp. A73]